MHNIKDNSNVFACELCDYAASRRPYLEQHYRRHRVIYVCVRCPAAIFPSSVRLREHLLQHLAADAAALQGTGCVDEGAAATEVAQAAVDVADSGIDIAGSSGDVTGAGTGAAGSGADAEGKGDPDGSGMGGSGVDSAAGAAEVDGTGTGVDGVGAAGDDADAGVDATGIGVDGLASGVGIAGVDVGGAAVDDIVEGNTIDIATTVIDVAAAAAELQDTTEVDMVVTEIGAVMDVAGGAAEDGVQMIGTEGGGMTEGDGFGAALMSTLVRAEDLEELFFACVEASLYLPEPLDGAPGWPVTEGDGAARAYVAVAVDGGGVTGDEVGAVTRALEEAGVALGATEGVVEEGVGAERGVKGEGSGGYAAEGEEGRVADGNAGGTAVVGDGRDAVFPPENSEEAAATARAAVQPELSSREVDDASVIEGHPVRSDAGNGIAESAAVDAYSNAAAECAAATADATEATDAADATDATPAGYGMWRRMGYQSLSRPLLEELRATFGNDECAYCGRLFSSNVDYEVHLRTHTGRGSHRHTANPETRHKIRYRLPVFLLISMK